MSDTIKTRAAVAFAPNEPLKVVEVDLQRPKAGEVLIEIMATGICHTDAYTLDGLDSEGLFPCILGHEGAGIVREIGEGVKSLAVGDHKASCLTGLRAFPMRAKPSIIIWVAQPSPIIQFCPKLPSRKSAKTRLLTRAAILAAA